ncbi:MAG: DUF4340 domain-containing protein [Verrucomicrobia bacterium]|nr:DUF4340 domain-containing protein [Verrucomicrobiota bacterium]
MKGKTTFYLLLLVVALGAFIALVERRGVSTDERKERAARAFRIQPETVTYLAIEMGEMSIECQKQEGHWFLTAPFRARADAGVIDRLLSHMSGLTSGEIVTEEDRRGRSLTLRDFGLEAPRGQIVYGDEHVRQTVLIGRDALVGNRLYVKEASGTDILTTETNLLSVLPGAVLDLRDHVLVHEQPSSIRRIDISRQDGFLQLTSDTAGRWMIQQPLATRADSQAVADLLSKIARARIADFVANEASDLSPYQLAEPAVTVSLWTDLEDKAVSFKLAESPGPDAAFVFAKREDEDSVMTVPVDLLRRLQVKVDDIRDRALLDRPLYEVDRLDIREDESRLLIEREKDGTWRMLEPLRERAEGDRVETFVMAWMSARISVFHDNPADLAAFGLDHPSRRVSFRFSRSEMRTVTDETGPQTETVTILLGEEDPGSTNLFVMLEDEGTVYTVAPILGDSVRLDASYFRSRTVMSLREEDIRRVTRTIGGEEESVERGADGVFVMQKGYSDQSSLQRLVQIVSKLRAVEFVADNTKDLELFGLDAPRAEITFWLTGESGISRTIYLGAETDDGGAYATLRGQETVFTLSSNTVKSLSRPWTTEKPVADEGVLEQKADRKGTEPFPGFGD